MRNINLSAYIKTELALFADVIADCVDRVVPNKSDVEYDDDTGALVKSFFTCDLISRTTLARKTLNIHQRDALELLWQSYAKECVFYNYLYFGVSKRFEVWHTRSKFSHLPDDASEIKEHICSMRKKRLAMFAKLLREAAE